jgi:hypothetical protein
MSLYDSQIHETVKYGHESHGFGIKDDCTGEDQQQFTDQSFFKGLIADQTAGEILGEVLTAY